MTVRVKAKVGDIFQIPLDDARVGYGQVVAQPEKNVLFICVFSATTHRGEQPDLETVVQSEILLAGNTFDAKIWHGHWPVVGNIPPSLGTISIPKYKVHIEGKVFVESLDQAQRRPCTATEEQMLPFRGYHSPIRFQDALRALAGNAEWSPSHEELRYEHVKRSSTVKI